MRIPLFPLSTVLFPGTALPLHIFEERYREMVAACLGEDKPFGVVQADGEKMAIVGCTAKIVRVVERYSDGRLDILCEGVRRFEIEGLDESQKYLQADVEFFEDEGAGSTRTDREDCAALHFATLQLAGIELLATRSDAERTTRLREFYNEVLPRLQSGIEDAGRTSRAGQGGGFPIH
jgi:Lon protease-like protein